MSGKTSPAYIKGSENNEVHLTVAGGKGHTCQVGTGGFVEVLSGFYKNY